MSKFYAVKKGREPGIYSTWAECQKHVLGFSGAVYKSFTRREEALMFLGNENKQRNGNQTKKRKAEDDNTSAKRIKNDHTDGKNVMKEFEKKKHKETKEEKTKREEAHFKQIVSMIDLQKDVVIFTDGSCKPNPGPAACAAILFSAHEQREQKEQKEQNDELNLKCLEQHRSFVPSASNDIGKPWSDASHECRVRDFGFYLNDRSTNNRGELTALKLAIELLEQMHSSTKNENAKKQQDETEPLNQCFIFADSEYAIKVIKKIWQAHDNLDLVLDLQKKYQQYSDERGKNGFKLHLNWVRAHNGNLGNERADRVANQFIDHH